MRIQEHIKLSTAAAVVALPWLKKDIWIPFVASIGIDVDHYLWHAVTHRTLSLPAAVHYFGQADPPRLPQAKLLHHPLVLGLLLFIATLTRSRILWLILEKTELFNFMSWDVWNRRSVTSRRTILEYDIIALTIDRQIHQVSFQISGMKCHECNELRSHNHPHLLNELRK